MLRSDAKLQFLQYAQAISCDVGMAQIKNRHFWGCAVTKTAISTVVALFFIFCKKKGIAACLVGRLSHWCFVKKADEIYLWLFRAFPPLLECFDEIVLWVAQDGHRRRHVASCHTHKPAYRTRVRLAKITNR